MKVLHARCAGLDVHKNLVVACARLQKGAKVQREQGRFEATTKGLLELLTWLTDHQCTNVAMEATGVYWKPVWQILEGHIELVLANPAHIRNVPGRKSDTNDATWIADLLAHGLITASMVPPTPIRDLRGLTRTRRQLAREITQHTLRVQKVLEEANVKLSSVVSNTMGVSGRRIIKAIVAGENDPDKLAALGSERLHCSQDTLREALRGHVTEHHRFLLQHHLETIAYLEKEVAQFDLRIAHLLEPFRGQCARLRTTPGLADTTIAALIAEIGVDMSCFPTAAHLLSWACLCPRLHESAGKSRSTRTRQGAAWLKPILVQCAWAAVRSKNTYAHAQFLRIRARRGAMKAIVAVASSLLKAAYYILRDGVEYRELGADYFVQRDRHRIATKLAQRLRNLGYQVSIQQPA